MLGSTWNPSGNPRSLRLTFNWENHSNVEHHDRVYVGRTQRFFFRDRLKRSFFARVRLCDVCYKELVSVSEAEVVCGADALW